MQQATCVMQNSINSNQIQMGFRIQNFVDTSVFGVPVCADLGVPAWIDLGVPKG